jgi:hypothetical protein
MFGFLMKDTSTWMVWLINKMCDFWHHRSTCYPRESASCTENYSVGRHLKSGTARANYFWRDSEQRALFKCVAECFVPHHVATGLPLQTVVHAGWSQAAHRECSFGLSAWHFRVVCPLKPIFW